MILARLLDIRSIHENNDTFKYQQQIIRKLNSASQNMKYLGIHIIKNVQDFARKL